MQQMTTLQSQSERPLSPDAENDRLSVLKQVFLEVGQHASLRELERTHPLEQLDLLRTVRFGALRIGREDGGQSATFRDLLGSVIALGDADPNVAHIFRNHFTFVERFARRPCTDQERQWQRLVVDGAVVGLANTELDSATIGGAPMSTKLTRDGIAYRLNGRKYYSTGTLYADLVQVRASTPDGSLASAIIPTDRTGVERLDDWDGTGQRLTGSGTTILTDVRVEADEVVIDGAGSGFGVAYSATLPQLYLTAIEAGILRSILRDAIALVSGRTRPFYYSPDKPPDDALLQNAIGELASSAFAAEAIVLAAADVLDRVDAVRAVGDDEGDLAERASLAAAQAKVVIDDLALRAGSRLFDVGGASATQRTKNLDRHWRNVRTLASHNPKALKARVIGDHLVNGIALPRSGFF
ncbi:acyl-CoA dehydrogenase [Methylobacterium sp. J-070]|uniref:acyl-CoA dehydrogenase n=1 Tax=Methylobacterium sp. J-070 TaxID=2836650 RepID=UPI001FBB3567|nr:acyl-CoA dehydrogenase [Methylobacterium sp. J-070]MCJ2049968.1 acyl-CoA dehydrogenase [Methylobacterium sp. J-070]